MLLNSKGMQRILIFTKRLKPAVYFLRLYKHYKQLKIKGVHMISKKLKQLSAFAFAAVLLTSCANTAHIEKDPSTNLSDYKTYSWISDDSADKKSKVHKNDLAESNIRAAVNQQLQSNGFTEVKRNPDLLITYDLLVEKSVKKQNEPVYSRPFTRPYYNPYRGRYGTIYYPSRFLGYDSYSTPVKEGTVTITMIDPKSDKTIWQGWATDEINSSNFTGKEIQKNVKSIFKKFDVAIR
jgi:hypothetical protein